MDAFTQQWSSAPVWIKFVTLAALPATGYAIARFLDEYRDWRRVGPGGLPYDVRGFVATLLLTATLARKDTKSLEMYQQPQKYASGWKQATEDEKKKAKQSFLKSPLQQREGKESNALHFVAPQRERNIDDLKYIDPEVMKAYWSTYKSIGEKHSEAIEWRTSGLEKQGQAIFLNESYKIPTLIAKCGREVLHIHESDMSAHVLLSLADAKDVIAKGWGERHRITGTFVVPQGYTMLYLPRNKDEVEVLGRILEAGVEYAKSNGKSS